MSEKIKRQVPIDASLDCHRQELKKKLREKVNNLSKERTNQKERKENDPKKARREYNAIIRTAMSSLASQISPNDAEESTNPE